MTSELRRPAPRHSSSDDELADPGAQTSALEKLPTYAEAELLPVPFVPTATETLTCPECGTAARVTLNRRDASDFCRSCDYPMFWTPTRVYTDTTARAADEALRRLPGTVGRATVASQPCPHCAEPNGLAAQICARCGQPMRLIQAPPPPPEPEYVAPPVEVEPERGVPWWVWALLIIGLTAAVVLIVLKATNTIS